MEEHYTSIRLPMPDIYDDDLSLGKRQGWFLEKISRRTDNFCPYEIEELAASAVLMFLNPAAVRGEYGQFLSVYRGDILAIMQSMDETSRKKQRSKPVCTQARVFKSVSFGGRDSLRSGLA